jgi:putative hydrolase of HD superfamily
MDVGAAFELLLQARQLKHTPRTGWVMRGVVGAESVADHSFGVAFIALVLSELVNAPVDQTKLLTIALLHDLPESVISDLPTPAMGYFPPGAKSQAESAVLSKLLLELPWTERWQGWWCEFEENSSAEGRLVRDADRLDMLIQAYAYEQTTGNRRLDEFWTGAEDYQFEFAASQALYETLTKRRQATCGSPTASGVS